MNYKLWPKQEEIVDEVWNNKSVLVLNLGRRTGKTLIGLHCALFGEVPKRWFIVSQVGDISRELFNAACVMDEECVGYVRDLQIISSKDSVVWFKTVRNFKNEVCDGDYVVFDNVKLDYEMVKWIQDFDGNVVIGGVYDPWGLVMLKDLIRDVKVITMSTPEVNPYVTREMLFEECSVFAKRRLHDDYLVDVE